MVGIELLDKRFWMWDDTLLKLSPSPDRPVSRTRAPSTMITSDCIGGEETRVLGSLNRAVF